MLEKTNVKVLDRVVVRFSGDSGDGMQLTGNMFAQLAAERTQRRLEQMREAAVGQLRREDALRRLAQLAFGQANDGVELALRGREASAEGLDLSAVAEIRVTDKGGVEVKFVDRVRALEALCGLLGGDTGRGAEELLQALSAAGEEEGAWEHG